MPRLLRPLAAAAVALLGVIAAAPTASAATEEKTGFITGYTIHDNDPAGRAIAFPGTVHDQAGGTGTYDDPITLAAQAGDYAPGTRIYVPHVDRYFLIEDTCASCGQRAEWIDMWIGGELSDPAGATAACAAALTGTFEFEVNPPRGRHVVQGPLFDSATDTCYVPTPGSPAGPAPQPQPEPAKAAATATPRAATPAPAPKPEATKAPAQPAPSQRPVAPAAKPAPAPESKAAPQAEDADADTTAATPATPEKVAKAPLRIDAPEIRSEQEAAPAPHLWERITTWLDSLRDSLFGR